MEEGWSPVEDFQEFFQTRADIKEVEMQEFLDVILGRIAMAEEERERSELIFVKTDPSKPDEPISLEKFLANLRAELEESNSGTREATAILGIIDAYQRERAGVRIELQATKRGLALIEWKLRQEGYFSPYREVKRLGEEIKSLKTLLQAQAQGPGVEVQKSFDYLSLSQAKQMGLLNQQIEAMTRIMSLKTSEDALKASKETPTPPAIEGKPASNKAGEGRGEEVKERGVGESLPLLEEKKGVTEREGGREVKKKLVIDNALSKRSGKEAVKRIKEDRGGEVV